MKRLLLFLVLAGMTACTYHYDSPQRGIGGTDAGTFRVRQYPNINTQTPGNIAGRQFDYVAAAVAARTPIDSATIMFSGQLAEINDSFQNTSARMELKIDAMETDMRRLQWMLGALMVLMAGLIVAALRFTPRRNPPARHRESRDAYSHTDIYANNLTTRDW